MSLFSGKFQWSNLVKVKSSLMKSPGLTGNDVTSSSITTRKVNVPSGVTAIGTFSITGGSGQIDSVQVNAPGPGLVIIITNPVPFNTDIDQTALDLINEINTTAWVGTVASIISSVAGTVTIQLVMPNTYDAGVIGVNTSGGTLSGAQVSPLALSPGGNSCCFVKDVLMNNGGASFTHRNKGGGITNCDCTTI